MNSAPKSTGVRQMVMSHSIIKEENIMKILVTGGAGYIGSHTCVELLNAGYEVVILDNLYNASEKAVDRIKEITGKDLTFYKADILDKEAMDKIFADEKPDCVIHFAGLKAVGESVVKPLEYYQNNITGTLNLCEVMRTDARTSSSHHQLQYTAILHLSLSRRSAQREHLRTHMAGQSG